MSNHATKQTAFGAVDGRDGGADYRESSSGGLDDILAQPAAVDALTPLQVKDAWVRGKLVRDIIEEYEQEARYDGGRSNPFALAEDAEADLREGKRPYAKLAGAGEDNSRNAILGRMQAARLRERSHAENVEALFDQFTRDAAEVERPPVEIAREKVKSALRGCGMPRMKVQRAAVEFHDENPEWLSG